MLFPGSLRGPKGKSPVLLEPLRQVGFNNTSSEMGASDISEVRVMSTPKAFFEGR